MTTYYGYVTYLRNVEKHPNADRLLIAKIFGSTICVSTDYKEGDVGIYFPSDGQLSLDFCIANHLLRALPDGTADTGYLDPHKRNIKPIKLRGVKSDGIFLPLDCLASFGDISTIKVGDKINIFNGHEICCKYIPKTNHHVNTNTNKKKDKKPKINIAPTFKEHADTEQLAYNLNDFNSGDQYEITLKMHGTSGRTGYLPVLKKVKHNFIDKLFKRPAVEYYEYDYVSGSRRRILENWNDGYYGNDAFRKNWHDFFVGKLWKGETVYYEILGYTNNGVAIMPPANNKKTNDKEFIKQYGEVTNYSYGCDPNGRDFNDIISTTNKPKSVIYVYRMTMTNSDGEVVEYTPDFMRYRCEQMGVNSVPVFEKGYIPKNPGSTEDDTITPGEWIQKVSEKYYDGPDPVGKTHIREGVVVRIINRPTFTAYKNKNWNFKLLEGIIKESAVAPDMEEAQDVE